MSASETKKDCKCLHENKVRCIQKISSCKSMFEALAIFEIELGFCGSEIKYYLNVPRREPENRMLELNVKGFGLHLLLPSMLWQRSK